MAVVRVFVPAIFGLTYLMTGLGSRAAISGGALTFFGAMAGAAMQVLFRVYAVLNEKNSPQTIELLRGTTKLVAATQMIGVSFPTGLLILAFCLYQTRVVSFAVIIAFAAGAIMFPVGRIGGFWWAFLSSDILLLAAFGLIGRRLLAAANASFEGENDFS